MYARKPADPRDGLKATQRRMIRVRQIKQTTDIAEFQPNWYPLARLRNLEMCNLYRQKMKQKGAN